VAEPGPSPIADQGPRAQTPAGPGFTVTWRPGSATAVVRASRNASDADAPAGAGGVWTVVAFDLSNGFYKPLVRASFRPNWFGARISGLAWGSGLYRGRRGLLLGVVRFVHRPTRYLFGLDIVLTQLEKRAMAGPVVAICCCLLLPPLHLDPPDRAAGDCRWARPFEPALVESGTPCVTCVSMPQLWRLHCLPAMLFHRWIEHPVLPSGVLRAGTFPHARGRSHQMFGLYPQNITSCAGCLALAGSMTRIGAKRTILSGNHWKFVMIGIPCFSWNRNSPSSFSGRCWVKSSSPVRRPAASLKRGSIPPGPKAKMFGLYGFIGKATAFLRPGPVAIGHNGEPEPALGMANASCHS